MLDAGTQARLEPLGQDQAMAAMRLPFEAEQAGRAVDPDETGQRLLLEERFRRRQMREEDPAQVVETSLPRRQPPLRRRAEGAQVSIVDTGLGQPGSQLALAEAWPARRGDRPHVDQQPDAGPAQG